MVLTSVDGKRSFKIYDQNWHFLMGVLAHDMLGNCTRSLSHTNPMLSAYECADVSNKIDSALSNNVIYEFWDGVKVEPLINPTKEMLDNLGNCVQPLTDKRKKFLENLSEFIRSSDELYIT